MLVPSITEPDTKEQYRAIGVIKGKYVPNKDVKTSGVFITDDGTELPCRLLPKVAKQLLSLKPELLKTENIYLCWFRTSQDQPLQIWIKTVFYGEMLPKLKMAVDQFSVRGQVCYQNTATRTLALRIYRNVEPKNQEDQKNPINWKPFPVNIEGVFPGKKALGEFWDVICYRDGNKLILQDARFVKKAPPGFVVTSKKPRKSNAPSKKPQKVIGKQVAPKRIEKPLGKGISPIKARK